MLKLGLIILFLLVALGGLFGFIEKPIKKIYPSTTNNEMAYAISLFLFTAITTPRDKD